MSFTTNYNTNIPWLAPLAGLTDSPFRKICREFGAKTLFTEMVSVEGLIRSHKKTFEYMRTLEGDSPVIVQLFGVKPESFFEAVKIVSEYEHVSGININSGCPVKKVLRVGAGCALMKTPQLIGKIVAECKRASSKPISVKFRMGINSETVNYTEYANVCQNEGADYLIMHARTAVMGYSGVADWDAIKKLKNTVKIPVIGNGDVRTIEDFENMKTQTGCDAVMVGRGAVGNPWLFKNEQKHLNSEYIETILRHLDYLEKFYGSKTTAKIFKTHMVYYLKNVNGLDPTRKREFQNVYLKMLKLDEQRKLIQALI